MICTIEDSNTFRKDLKKILTGYSTWNSKIIQNLEGLGFLVEMNRKHAILKININDKKYMFVISKTPSDKRAGMNNVSIICRTLFSS
jgi:hypothetical protein